MKMLTRLMKTQPARPPRTTWREVALLDLLSEAEDAGALEPRPPGCGWFDSSHELQCGLAVTEHLSADAVASELPLGDWLELHLSGWRAAGAASRPLA